MCWGVGEIRKDVWEWRSVGRVWESVWGEWGKDVGRVMGKM